jgi:23S rRNA (uracil1939-C5)-methyltransferase
MPDTAEEFELAIASVAYRGAGVARREGFVFFVPGTAPGERVRARLVRRHSRYAEAALTEVLAPSPDRIAPCCRLADGTRVPGCVYDHLAYPAEVALKQSQAEDFLRRLPGGPAFAFAPPFPSPRALHYRNKLVLHARRLPGEKTPRLGYFGDDNRRVLDLPACPLAREPINAALTAFRAGETFAALRDGQTATFRWTARDGVVRWLDDRLPRDPPRLTEETPCGPLAVPLDGFFQVNPEVAAGIVRQVVAWVTADGAPERVLDLYCGAGVLALACARAGVRRVAGIESGRAAVAAARANAAALGCADAVFRCQSAAAAAGRAFDGFVNARTTVVANPPRRGLEPAVARALADSRAPRLVYVACDPATLARDLRPLLAAGFVPRAARVFDLFPRTAHFETAILLDRPAP